MEFRKLNSALLLILVIIAVGGVFHLTAAILIPLVVALLLTFVFTPFVDFLSEKARIPRVFVILIVIIILLGFCFLIGLFLYSSFISLFAQFPKYQQRFTELFGYLVQALNLPDDILDQIDWVGTIGGSVVSFSGGFMGFMGGIVLVFVFLFFLLLEKPYLKGKMEQAFKTDLTRKIISIFRHINDQIGHYLTIKLIISLITGLLVWLFFSIIGLDFAFVWGALAFVFNFIPNIGSIVIGIISALFAVLQFYPAWDRIAATAGVMLAIQLVMGNVIDPKLQGDRLNLSPVIILISLFLWGWIWGVAGMFLAIPLTVTIKIAFENIPGMEPIGIMMGTGNLRAIFRRREKKSNNDEKENPNR